MANYKHGEMDTTAHEQTFGGFVKLAIWGASITIGVLIFLALANA